MPTCTLRHTRPVARLCDPVKQHYEVFFTYYDDQGKKHVYRWKRGINSLPADERKKGAEQFATEFYFALKGGWNPMAGRIPEFERHRKKLHNLTFCEAVDYCLAEKEKKLSLYSLYGYRNCARHMKEAAVKAGYGQARIALMERRDIRVIIEEGKDLHDWTAHTRNQYVALLKALFGVLIDKDLLKFNPVSGIRKESAPARKKPYRLSAEERDRIYTHLLSKAPDYLDFIQFIYQLGFRPKELLLIKLSDIDIAFRRIVVRAEVAKTNTERVVPITDDILEILAGKNIATLPKNWYLFSSNDFAPGERPFHRDTSTSWWRRLVKEDLCIPCNQYHLKHRGGVDKVKAGVDPSDIKELFGHSTDQMTKTYIADALEERMNEQIIAKAPKFSTKVVEMKRKAE